MCGGCLRAFPALISLIMKVKLCEAFAVGMMATNNDLIKYPSLRECKTVFILADSRFHYTDSTRVKDWIEEMNKEVNFRFDNATYLKFKELLDAAHFAGWQIKKPKPKIAIQAKFWDH